MEPKGISLLVGGLFVMLAAFMAASLDKVPLEIPAEIPEEELSIIEETATSTPVVSIESKSSTTPPSVSLSPQKPPKIPSEEDSDDLKSAVAAALRLQTAVRNLESDLSLYQQKLVAIQTEKAEETVADFAASNDKARQAVVNILCETTSGGSFNPISGSGIVIDPRGIILTNAHIGQYFLLKDYIRPGFINCTVRTGSPARNAYKAELVYISPTWLKKNAASIKEENPLGTGENDFALLVITETVSGESDIPVLPYLPFTPATLPQSGESVVLAGYPSGFLGGITVQLNLYQISSVGAVSSLYTLDGSNVDIIEVEGSLLSQKGSSGGAFVNGKGTLLGVITTAQLDAASTADRSVRAITIDHINRKITAETGKTLESIVGHGIPSLIVSFAQIEPSLKKILVDALEGS